ILVQGEPLQGADQSLLDTLLQQSLVVLLPFKTRLQSFEIGLSPDLGHIPKIKPLCRSQFFVFCGHVYPPFRSVHVNGRLFESPISHRWDWSKIATRRTISARERDEVIVRSAMAKY